jgi:hypothetical protein
MQGRQSLRPGKKVPLRRAAWLLRQGPNRVRLVTKGGAQP